MLSTSAECRRLVDRLSRSVHGAVGGAGKVLESAGALMDEEKALADRQSLLDRFGERFLVTRGERAVLSGDWRPAVGGRQLLFFYFFCFPFFFFLSSPFCFLIFFSFLS